MREKKRGREKEGERKGGETEGGRKRERERAGRVELSSN